MAPNRTTGSQQESEAKSISCPLPALYRGHADPGAATVPRLRSRDPPTFLSHRQHLGLCPAADEQRQELLKGGGGAELVRGPAVLPAAPHGPGRSAEHEQRARHEHPLLAHQQHPGVDRPRLRRAHPGPELVQRLHLHGPGVELAARLQGGGLCHPVVHLHFPQPGGRLVHGAEALHLLLRPCCGSPHLHGACSQSDHLSKASRGPGGPTDLPATCAAGDVAGSPEVVPQAPHGPGRPAAGDRRSGRGGLEVHHQRDRGLGWPLLQRGLRGPELVERPGLQHPALASDPTIGHWESAALSPAFHAPSSEVTVEPTLRPTPEPGGSREAVWLPAQ
ncbi:uncharacterized protein LOC115943862 [Leptonychotes weddellii]|uniref:Uncharacterized protein LOC115943862 n=1 Tax=Leptonychotes weddellii TaxID=9713 RepID=A0A7F8RK52_LEPWE|nr:uncharacterized protein LOC115943862 [Leptonychotes weddellii]